MSIKIGVSAIAWQNDDLPELTAAYTMEQALAEAREIGYLGIERGRRMPPETEALRDYLDAAGIALCGGWCSGALLANDVTTEIDAVRAQVEQFAALGAPCIVYAECSNTVQGKRLTPLSRRPKLARDEIRAYAGRLGELAKWTADQGVPLAYHHHMGSCIEDEEDIDRLLEATPDEVGLCYDTGHLLFGGADDVTGVLGRWGERVVHVHVKDVRPDVMGEMRARDASFLDAVVAGVFTVPGDGCLDFRPVAEHLAATGYAGWIVVEAEQDPATAPPYEYARRGYEHLIEVCAGAGLEVTE